MLFTGTKYEQKFLDEYPFHELLSQAFTYWKDKLSGRLLIREVINGREKSADLGFSIVGKNDLFMC